MKKRSRDGEETSPYPIDQEGRKERRHSSFWLGLYSVYWTINDEFLWEYVENLMKLNPHKLPYYRKGVKAMNTLLNI